MQLPETQLGNDDTGRVETAAINQTSQSQSVAAQREHWQSELLQERTQCFPSCLRQHCLPTSKTAVAQFCHLVLGESVRPRKRPVRKRQTLAMSGNGEGMTPEPSSATEVAVATESPTNPDGGGATPGRARGPRIAHVRMLKSQTT